MFGGNESYFGWKWKIALTTKMTKTKQNIHLIDYNKKYCHAIAINY